MPAAGGELAIPVATTSTCGWTAASNSPFITVISGTSGIGNGTARFSVQANTGAERNGSVTVAGSSLSVRQSASGGQPCQVSVNQAQIAMVRQGGDTAVDVAAASGCSWSATSSSAFITISNGQVGTGNGRVTLRVEKNGGELREGTVTIGGRIVSIIQEGDDAASCALAVSADRLTAPSAGQTVSVTITAPTGSTCPWTAESRASFVAVHTPSGTGAGSVTLTIAPNPQAARNGVVIVAGQTVTIEQASANTCATGVSPSTITMPAGGGSQSVQVAAPAECAWSAAADAAFVSVPSQLFVGSATIAVAAAANTSGLARTATLTVAGRTVPIEQPAPASPVALLTFQSDPGDYIGQGQTASYTLGSAEFTATTDATRSLLAFDMPGAGPVSWSLYLKAPSGQLLTAGLYSRAARYPFQPADLAGLSFSGSGRGCNRLTGRFLIAEATYGPGNAVQRFHARFEQHCEGSSAALRGQIWIDAAGADPPPLQAFPPPPATPTTSLSFVSDPGDYIGQGQTASYTFAGNEWSAWSSAGGRVVDISMQAQSGSAWWSLSLSAPQGQTLQPGTYTGATRHPFQAPTVPGLSFSGSGRGCNTLTGSFTVLEIALGPQGEIERLHATFEQHCEGAAPALRGEVRIAADPWR